SFCQFAEPGLLLLARQTDQAHQCFLPFLAFVFGPLVGSLLFAFLFALLALLLTSNRKFMASGFGLCVACLFLAVLDDRRDHVFQDGARYAEPFSAAVDPQPPLSGPWLASRLASTITRLAFSSDVPSTLGKS